MRTSNNTETTTTRTNYLKELVQTKLKTLTSKVYYEVASSKSIYPHVVFSFDRIDLGDLARQDYILNIDVWDKQQDTEPIDSLCDNIENLLQAQNLPQDHVLPTFYLMDRNRVFDEDVLIKHLVIRFQIQNYER